jgi:hypothetical protein
VFLKLREALGYGWIDFEEHFEIARAQSETFVAAIGTPREEDFENALERIRPKTDLDEILGH